MAIAALAPTLLPALLLCGYLIVAPNLRVVPSIDVYDERRLLELVTLILACIAWATRARRGNNAIAAPQRGWRWGAIFVVACGVVSAVRAPHPREALLEVALLTTIALATSVCTFAAASDRPVFRRLVGASLLVSAALSIAAFVANLFAMASMGETLTAAKLFSGFTTPRFLGQWHTWSLALIALPLSYAPPLAPMLRFLVGTVAVGWWMLAFAAGTRGTLLGVAIGLCATASLVRPVPRAWLAQQLMLALGGALAFVLVYVAATGGLDGFGASVAHLGTTGDSGRLSLWRSALDLIRSAPLLGVGPHHYGYHANTPVAHPHNAILQLASEWGLPATLVMLAGSALAARGWLRRLRSGTTIEVSGEDVAVRCALTTTLVAAGVHASLSGLIVMPISQVAAALVLAWAWAESARPVYVAETLGSTFPPARWLVACSLWLLAAAGPDLLDLRAYERGVLPQTHFRPRVWKEGASNYSLTRMDDPALEVEH